MRLCFLGSGIESESTNLVGIEVDAIARVVRRRFETLVFGGSSAGVMYEFANAFRSLGGRVVSVAPHWLVHEGLVFEGDETVLCDTLAERKQKMFHDIDAVLCYPGGVGTWDELFEVLASYAVERADDCPPVYLYSWEKFYAPLVLQFEVAEELALVHPHALASLRVFESASSLASLLKDAGSPDANEPVPRDG